MKLSVCIPVYKVEAYIEKCARSLFGQTLEDMEFLFVDDCSPDGSIEIVKRTLADYPARQPQVKFIRHEANRGLAAARKTALAAATGDWIAHCDSDDWVDLNLYETMLNVAVETDADMVCCSVARDEGRERGTRPSSLDPRPSFLVSRPSSLSAPEFLDAIGRIPSFNPVWNKLCRREIACSPDIEVPDSVTLAEDCCRTVQTVAKCRRIVSVEGPCYHYRVNASSMSRAFDAEKSVRSLVAVYEAFRRRVPGEMAARARKSVLRDAINFAVRFNVLSKDEFTRLVVEFRAMEDIPWPEDTSAYRRFLVEIACRSRLLARLVAAASRFKSFGGF